MTSKPPYKIKKWTILNVKIHKLIKNTDCSICRLNLNYESMNIKDDNNIVIGNCGHAFHFGCINTWLVQNTTCPLCCETWSIFKESISPFELPATLIPTTPPTTPPPTPPPTPPTVLPTVPVNWSDQNV